MNIIKTNWSQLATFYNIKNLRQFRAHFGFSFEVLDVAWTCLYSLSIPKLHQKHLLWWLLYVRLAGTLDQIVVFVHVTDKTVLKWRNIISKGLKKSLNFIQWSYRFEHSICIDPSCSVDTTACPIIRPNEDIQYLYFSVKHQYHCLKYEIAVNMTDGCACWLAGPFPGSDHDLTIGRSGLNFMMLPGETATADKAYIGDSHFLTPFKPSVTLQENLFNRKLARIHVKVENTNCDVKRFVLLRTAFRGSIEDHTNYFYPIMHLLNVETRLN